MCFSVPLLLPGLNGKIMEANLFCYNIADEILLKLI